MPYFEHRNILFADHSMQANILAGLWVMNTVALLEECDAMEVIAANSVERRVC
jgi:hypothetical protein